MTSLAGPAEAARALEGHTPSDAGLRRRVAELAERLREAEETLDAIRAGEVDAVVVGGDGSANGASPRVYTLETADQPYRLLIEEIQEGALTLDTDGVVLYCNRALAAMLRTAPARVIGARLGDFLTVGAQRDNLVQLLARGRGRAGFVLRTESGAALPVRLSLSEISRGNGSGDGRVLCGVLVDLTEQEARARELTEAYARLSLEVAERQRVEAELQQTQKMEALGQLAGGVAHDFNNAAAVVLAGLALLEKRHGAALVALGPEAARLLAGMKQAAERGGSVAHRLLAFARREELCAIAADPNALLDSLREALAHSLGPGTQVQVGAAVETVPDRGGQRCPTGLANGEYLRLWVADSGVGMDAATLARATDPFFTTKAKDRGTGLGLSMAAGFAAQSGGALAIESQPGHGTTVSVWLPRAWD